MGDPLLGKIYARMGLAPKPPNGTGSKLFMRTSDRYQIVSESHRIGIGSDRYRIESGSDRIGIGSGSERIWIGSDREGPRWPDVEKFTAMLDWPFYMISLSACSPFLGLSGPAFRGSYFTKGSENVFFSPIRWFWRFFLFTKPVPNTFRHIYNKIIIIIQ